MISEAISPKIVQARAWNCLAHFQMPEAAFFVNEGAIYDELVGEKLWEPCGGFRYAIPSDIRRKVVAVERVAGKIVSYALLAETDPHILRANERPGHLGLAGVWTRPDMRGRGYARRSVKRMSDFLYRALPRTFHESGNIVVEKRVLPLFREMMPVKVYPRWFPI